MNLRRTILATIALGSAGLIVHSGALAADYPAKPIRLVVGFPAGGAADTVARIVAEKMAHDLGQPIIIDNKPGAGTTIANETVASATGDGYTLLLGSPILFGVDKVLYKSIRYSASDLKAVSRWVASPMILAVNPDLPAKTAADIVALAKKEPDRMFFASSGSGGSPHLAGALFNEAAHIKLTHVPFKGGAQAVQAVVANDAQLTFATPPSVMPLINAGRLRAIAVTSAQRSPTLPNVPTIAEQGVPGYELTFWFGLFAPGTTPAPIVKKLFDASQKALADPEVKRKLALQGNDVAVSASSEEFGQWVISQGVKQKKLAEVAGAKLD